MPLGSEIHVSLMPLASDLHISACEGAGEGAGDSLPPPIKTKWKKNALGY